MRKNLLILALLSVGFTSHSQSSLSTTTQSSSSEQPRNTSGTATTNGLGDTASLQKEVTALGGFKYTFQSDKILEPGKVSRWETRYKQQFLQIIDLQLTSSTQIVVVTLDSSHSEQDLLEIVQRFDYLNYSVTE